MRTLIGLVALFGVLTAQDLKSAEKALQQALKESNRKGVESAAAALLTAGSPESMKVLLNALAKPPAHDKKDKEPDESAASECYFTLLNAASSFSDPAALGSFADFISDSAVTARRSVRDIARFLRWRSSATSFASESSPTT